MKKIYIGIPAFKDVPIEFVLSLSNLLLYSSNKYDIIVGVETRTHRNLARENSIRLAKEYGADLLFIDDDMVFPGNALEVLDSNNVDIVSGLSFTRNPEHLPTCLQVEYYMKDDNVYEKYSPMKDYPKDQLFEVAATGLAFTLIRNNVLISLGDYACSSKEGAAEDVELFRQARERGFKAHMDSRVKIGHLGSRKVIDEEVYNNQVNKE
jgi:hypothetical protein